MPWTAKLFNSNEIVSWRNESHGDVVIVMSKT